MGKGKLILTDVVWKDFGETLWLRGELAVKQRFKQALCCI